jgi:hypothetical protein
MSFSSFSAHFAVQVAFGSMNEHELRAHMHDMWDALYMRLRPSCPQRAAQVCSRPLATASSLALYASPHLRSCRDVARAFTTRWSHARRLRLTC